VTTKEKIKSLKNFASMDKSFKEWLTTCPREYIWQIDLVDSKDQGTFTFMRPTETSFELILQEVA